MNHAGKFLKTQEVSQSTHSEPDGRREVLQAVLCSAVFARSPRLRDFLQFVGTRALDGRSHEITEYELGVHVFGKPAHFNPAEDNIVRASARTLRLKLREYFEGEGAAQPWRIEIPKGAYTPAFTPPPPAASSQAVPATWLRFAVVGLALLTLALTIEVVRLRTAAPAEPRTLWSVLMHGRPNVNLVGSDSLHQHYQIAEGKLTPFSEYVSGDALPHEAPPGASDGTVRMWPLISSQTWSHIEDLRVALRLAVRLPDRGNVDLLHPRQLRMQNFRRGEDFVIIGGPRANPWAGLFEPGLNFQMIFPTATAVAEIHNAKPQPGEEPRYISGGSKGYGRIAVVPGLAGRGTVILIGGSTTPATDASGELLLSPTSLAELERRLGRTLARGQPQRLEILIETSSVSGTTKDYRIVAIR